MTALVSLFAKPPRAGRVKTRLAAAVGHQRAAGLARAFLLDTWSSVATAHPWARPVLAVTASLDRDLLACLQPPPPEIWHQGEGDLGQRMLRVLRAGLRREPRSIVVGSDIPGCPPERLDQAHAALEQGADAVLGPADDGGFYLVGLARGDATGGDGGDRYEALLDRLPWSTASTFRLTLQRLQQRGLRVALCDPWFDVDLPADLSRLDDLLRRGEIDAPATARALRGAVVIVGDEHDHQGRSSQF